jgi:membrane peptidoglycan carboxypeptidase
MGYANSQDPAKASLRNIKGVGRVFGGTLPAQTWHNFMSVALKDVPVTDFDQPAPIKQLADALKAQARQGIDPGGKRTPSGTDDGGPYIISPPAPKVDAPTTTTTTAPDQGGGPGGGTSTTTTTSIVLRP